MSSLTGNLYAFGQFQVDEQNRALHRGGEPIALTPKAFEVLLLLIQHSGEVVSKDELMQTIWGDSFVEESNLTQTVFMLRKALGESASQRYILTVQGKGYRFTSDVKALPANGHTSATLPRAIFDRENSTGSVADVLPPRRRNSPRTPIVVGIFTVVVIAAVAWLYSVFSRRGEASFPLRRRLATRQFFRRPRTGVFRRRHDRSADHRFSQGQLPASDLPDFGDAL
jgi:DNA-binding winged helix-turn-helix (wHTH) protein